ncbi:FAD dependent oxidoreductase-domain-containing protein [Mycena rebaudengoi]|nr:FAD dependent oxidoreductase-domain-containing protein [Mycena rebaudengoi]
MRSSQPTTASAFDRIEGGRAFPIPTGMSLSYWLQGVRASPLLDHRTTEELPKSADVVIIGSGMCGTLVAYELLMRPNPPKSVVILEAREMCSGATGKNAGHCKPDQYRGFPKYEKNFGAEQAKKLLEHEFETWSRLVKFVHEEKVDCELWVGDTIDVAMSPEVANTLSAAFEACKACGGKVDHIKYISNPVEAEKVSRLKGAQAVWTWKASTFYPWKLDLGPQLPPSRASTEADRLWDVHTARGGHVDTHGRVCNKCIHFVHPPFVFEIHPAGRAHGNKVVPPRAFAGSKALQNSYGILAARGGHYSINPRCNADGHPPVRGERPEPEEAQRIFGRRSDAAI